MNEYTLTEYEEGPFTSIEHRGDVVEHRVVVQSHDGVGVDVRHEIRSGEDVPGPDEWTEVEVVESREHGVETVDGPEAGRWFA